MVRAELFLWSFSEETGMSDNLPTKRNLLSQVFQSQTILQTIWSLKKTRKMPSLKNPNWNDWGKIFSKIKDHLKDRFIGEKSFEMIAKWPMSWSVISQSFYRADQKIGWKLRENIPESPLRVGMGFLPPSLLAAAAVAVKSALFSSTRLSLLFQPEKFVNKIVSLGVKNSHTKQFSTLNVILSLQGGFVSHV